MDKYKPDTVAVEKLFFNRNVTTAFYGRSSAGVIILAAAQRGIAGRGIYAASSETGRRRLRQGGEAAGAGDGSHVPESSRHSEAG